MTDWIAVGLFACLACSVGLWLYTCFKDVMKEKCPKVLKANTLTSFTICPVCGLIISNGFEGLLLHPLAQGIGVENYKRVGYKPASELGVNNG